MVRQSPGTYTYRHTPALLDALPLVPGFAKPGERRDITVSALGKAKSLRGGTLVLTPLRGADGQIYAMAQGNLAVGGLGVDGADGSKLSVNIPSAGRIPGGASVEQAVATGFADSPSLTFNLAEADLTTALRVADAINQIGRAHTSELQSLMRISNAVFCLKKKNNTTTV